jgi:hypothetical protein
MELNMTRAELLDQASMKMAEVVILLSAAGEKQLAANAEELAELIEFSAIPLEAKKQNPSRSCN